MTMCAGSCDLFLTCLQVAIILQLFVLECKYEWLASLSAAIHLQLEMFLFVQGTISEIKLICDLILQVEFAPVHKALENTMYYI